jgi:hypothetical protein
MSSVDYDDPIAKRCREIDATIARLNDFSNRSRSVHEEFQPGWQHFDFEIEQQKHSIAEADLPCGPVENVHATQEHKELAAAIVDVNLLSIFTATDRNGRSWNIRVVKNDLGEREMETEDGRKVFQVMRGVYQVICGGPIVVAVALGPIAS